MQVPAPWTNGLEISRTRQNGLVRWPEIRRATEKPRDVLRKHIQHFARGFAPRETFRVGRENREVAVPRGGKFAALNPVYLGRELGAFGPVGVKECDPFAPCLRAACAHSLRKVVIDTLGHKEFRIFGPSVVALS